MIKTTIMKTTPTRCTIPQDGMEVDPACRTFKFYRQSQAGNYPAEFSTDSAEKAVEVFLAGSPAFEGADCASGTPGSRGPARLFSGSQRKPI